MSLPKDLYPLTKDVPITSEWLFGHDINVMVNKIKAQQKVFTEDKTYINQKRHLIGKPIFLNKIQKTGRFPKIPG